MPVKKKKTVKASKVCVICKGNKTISKKKKCCSFSMTSSKKGTWNA